MRVVLFTGTGGVGKTTAASADALRLADRGLKTLLLATDPARSLGDALGVPLTAEPAEVAPGLWAVQPGSRPAAAGGPVANYLLDLLAAADPGAAAAIAAADLTVLPGVAEVRRLLAVHELAASGSWDALVVDCAAAAETLRLLALPELLSRWLQQLLPIQQRVAGGVRPLAALFGRGEALPSDAVFAALRNLADELAALRRLLGDPSVTSVRLVLTPEARVIAEARRTFTALALYGYAVDLVVANRVFPPGGDDWRARWAHAQQDQLAAIRGSFAGLAVRELSYRDHEPVGADDLRAVADELYGPLPGTDPAAVPDTPPPMRVTQDDVDLVLHLFLPLAAREDVDAVRVGDDLAITVGPHRRVLALPDLLRGCSVVAGEFDGAELRVRFRPDPDAAAPRRRPRPGTAP